MLAQYDQSSRLVCVDYLAKWCDKSRSPTRCEYRIVVWMLL